MKKKEKEFIVVLENIRSLYNVGSIFRTADGLGFYKVYLCGYTPAPISGRQKLSIHKTALGAEENISWEKNNSCWRLLDKLKKDGYFIVGLEEGIKNKVFLNKFKFNKGQNKVALVLGNEVEGLSSPILKRCDSILEIPTLGEKKSFNVSVSFGIAGFWIKNIK